MDVASVRLFKVVLLPDDGLPTSAMSGSRGIFGVYRAGKESSLAIVVLPEGLDEAQCRQWARRLWFGVDVAVTLACLKIASCCMHEPSRPDDLEKGIQGHPVHASLLFTRQGRSMKNIVNLCFRLWTVQEYEQTEPNEIKSLVKSKEWTVSHNLIVAAGPLWPITEGHP